MHHRPVSRLISIGKDWLRGELSIIIPNADPTSSLRIWSATKLVKVLAKVPGPSLSLAPFALAITADLIWRKVPTQKEVTKVMAALVEAAISWLRYPKVIPVWMMSAVDCILAAGAA